MKQDRAELDVGWRRQSNDLLYFIRLLRRQIVPLVLFPAVCILIGFGYIVFTTPRYSSSAFLSLEARDATSETLSAALMSHTTRILSNEITAQVIEKLDLDADVTVERGLLDRLVGALRGGLGLETHEEMSDEEIHTIIANRVVDSLAVQRVGDSMIMRVTYTAETPRDAAAIANAYVDVYVETLVGRSRETMERRAEFLQSRVEEIKELAASSYQEARQIRSRDGVDLGDFEDLDVRVARLTAARSEIDEAKAGIEARLSLMENTDGIDALQVSALQVEGGPDLFYAYKEASGRLEQLRASNDAPPSIAPLETSVVQLRRDLEQLLDRTRSSFEQELVILSARRDSINEDLRRAVLETTRRNWSEILIVEHQAGVFQNLYAEHLRELEDVYGRAGNVPISVMAHARPSVEPTWPNYKLILILSAMGGLALGVAVAMLREWEASYRPLGRDHPESGPQ